jgi:transcriptional regulator with XRE-family HTH domain
MQATTHQTDASPSYDSEVRRALDADLRLRRLSKKDFAEKVGVSYEAVRKWEQADRVPTDRWEKIREVLGPQSEVLRLARKQSDADVAQHLWERAQELDDPERFGRGYPLPVKSREEPETPDLREHTPSRRLAGSLPPQLVPFVYFHSQVGSKQPESRRADYSSPNLILELKVCATPANLSNVVYRGAMTVLLAKALSSQPNPDRKFVVAVLVPPPLLTDLRYAELRQRLSADLDLLGLGLLYASRHEEVAEYIAAQEGITPGDHTPPDYDFSAEDD